MGGDGFGVVGWFALVMLERMLLLFWWWTGRVVSCRVVSAGKRVGWVGVGQRLSPRLLEAFVERLTGFGWKDVDIHVRTQYLLLLCFCRVHVHLLLSCTRSGS